MKILIALLLVCVGSTGFWALIDRPLDAAPWSAKLGGVSYNASGLYDRAALEQPVSEATLRADLRQLARLTPRIRTYSVAGGLDRIPSIAKSVGLKVTLGIWLSDDRALNEAELARGIKVANEYPDVIERVIVGNEVVLRGELSADAVVGYMRRVRDALSDPDIAVGTADVWSTWLAHPELAVGSDFIGVHLLPYWEGVAAADAMHYIGDRMHRLERRFVGKPIVIAEAGWPSQGRVKQGAVPSAAYEAMFVRNFAKLAAARGYDYFIIEAYDQPWKAASEGAVGAFWGLYDADRVAKFSFTEALSALPEWRTYALVSAVATALLGMLLLSLLPALRFAGCLLLSGMLALVVAGATCIVDAMSLRYFETSGLVGALLLGPMVLFAAAVLLSETCEWVLSLWRAERRSLTPMALDAAPRVSIHVPTHREPAAMVIATLDALARLEYPNFEVIVLDNNTPDEADWRPVADHCRQLGARFRFYHLDEVRGFKAGALNEALALTDPMATLVAVIDSDYQVAADWLSRAVAPFADPQVALVQAPQDYRDAGEGLLKRCCFEEYRAFFHVGMVERAEHNAIIQHGTMCVLRRAALDAVGGWAPWCITEDTELGLRLLAAGHTAHYLPLSLGRGLMPDTYAAYKTQRHRWVYGAMQILKRHAGTLFRRNDALSAAQRYHFIAGWMPWFADALALLFGGLAVVWTLLVAAVPKVFDVPLSALSAVALAVFAVKTAKTLTLQRAKVGASPLAAIAAATAGLSLAYTVGKAVWLGLFTSSKPFIRTPKCAQAAPLQAALAMARAETVMFGLLTAAWLISVLLIGVDDPAEQVWAVLLVVMAIPYAAAMAVALASSVGRRRASLRAPTAAATDPITADLAT
jgi:exo-beta-1,3-glucanase (GH17 family)/cellulose synthase/poly-beta-1,6-N-acetylglucosamine synthase-like glycosyltransferase